MKPVFANLKKTSSVLAAAALLSFGSAKLQAAPIIEKIISPASDNTVSVKFEGVSDNSLVFHLKYENNSGEKFWLIVKNDAGEIVYQNSFNDVHFERNIRIANEESELNPTFVIRTSKAELERKFSVKSKVSESYVVTQVK